MNRRKALVIPDFASEARFSSVKKSFEERALRSVCALPLTTTHRRGFLGQTLGARALGQGKPWTGGADDFAEFDEETGSKRSAAGFRNACALPLAPTKSL